MENILKKGGQNFSNYVINSDGNVAVGQLVGIL